MDQSVTTEKPFPKPTGLGNRHGQVLLMFFGLVLAYCVRVNLSVGILAMSTQNHNFPNLQAMNFTSGQRAMILSSFFWGYMVLQVPGGYLARRYDPIYILSAAITLSGLITLLTPMATIQFGWLMLVVTRILVGLSQGFLYPCVNEHVSKWSTPQERGRFFAFVFAGAELGSVIMLMFGGIIANYAGGWPSIFYFSGLFIVVWGLLCAKYGASSPKSHKTISLEEKNYIESNMTSLADNCDRLPTPWKEILLSGPMYALLATYLCHIWGYWTLLTLTPSYISGVLKFDLQSDGVLSSVPYIATWIMSFVYSFVSDYLINKNVLKLQTSRKLCNSIALYGSSICLIILAFAKTDVIFAISLLTISSGLSSATFVGYTLNPTDLSPNFTSTLMGIANGLSNITAILGPAVSSYIVTKMDNVDQWRIVFLLASGILIFGNTVFLIFGSAQVQPWNEPKERSIFASEENDSIS